MLIEWRLKSLILNLYFVNGVNGHKLTASYFHSNIFTISKQMRKDSFEKQNRGHIFNIVLLFFDILSVL